jgi:hypothetical protein
MAKNNLDELLNKSGPGPLRRGKGVTLSVDEPPVPGSDPERPVQNSSYAEMQNSRKAEKPKKVIRPSKGYMIRSDIDRECKVLAAEKGRPLYEIMEAALIAYLRKHGRNIS